MEEGFKKGGGIETEADGRKKEGKERKVAERLWRQEIRHGYYRCYQMYT